MVLTLVKNEWQAVIAVVLLSVSVCLNGFIQPLLAAEIFGRSAYNTTLGIMMAMLSVGGLLSSPLVNFSFDATGSYTRILIVLAVIAAVDALFLLPAFHAEAKYRRELEIVRDQQLDILHFEENMNAFKEGFGRNYRIASEKFRTAIDEIDKTITHLQKIKDALLSSENNLRLANNKAEDLSIKKLTKNAPSVKAMFDEQREKKEE